MVHYKDEPVFLIWIHFERIDFLKIMILISNLNGLIQVNDSHPCSASEKSDVFLSLDLFADGNDFSWESIAKGRNLYYQQQTADLINDQTRKTISLLTSALNVHLNQGEHFTTNTSSVFMSLEMLSFEFLSNKTIQTRGNAQIHLPSNLSSNHRMVSLRVCCILGGKPG